jgi:light-harvesting complex I chlorophyll a/b binding protein 1
LHLYNQQNQMVAAMLSSRVASTTSFAARKATRPSRAAVRVQAAEGGLTPGQEYAKTLPGISQPFPNMFDPLNLSSTAKPAEIKRWRESEVTHGRVAMLAALGFVVGEQLQDSSAFMNFDGQVSGPAIYQFQQIEEKRPLFWETLLLFIGLTESYRVSVGWATPTGTGFNALKDDYEPGNLGFDPLGLLPSDPAEKSVMQTKELNNGRLAMIAIAGFVLQELVPPHREIFEHLGLYVEREAILELEDVDPALKSALSLPEIPAN